MSLLKLLRRTEKPDTEVGFALASISFLILYILLIVVLFFFRNLQTPTTTATAEPMPYKLVIIRQNVKQ